MFFFQTTYSISTSDSELFLADAVQSTVIAFNDTEQRTLAENRMVSGLAYSKTYPKTEGTSV